MAEARIFGWVKDTEGNSLGKVTVRCLKGKGRRVQTVKTNNKGYYQIQDLPAGTYRLNFVKTGYKTVITKNVKLPPDQRRNAKMVRK